MTDPNDILNRILPEKIDLIIASDEIKGYNQAIANTRKRLLDTYGKEWVGVPDKKRIKEIIEKEGWALRSKWVPECTCDNTNDSCCDYYKWSEDEERHIDNLTESILKGLTNPPSLRGKG